jgi:hypothetical protein
MQAEFEAKEWDVCGEFVTPSAEPVPTRVEPPRFPPPPWAVDYDPALDPDHEPPMSKPEEREP